MSVLKSTGVLASSSVGAMACQALTLHLYARRFSSVDLADYFPAMAAAMVVSPLISLGVNDGVLYYIGQQRNDRGKALRVLSSALAFYCFAGAVVLACFAVIPGLFSRLMFSTKDEQWLVGAVFALAFSRTVYDACLRYLTASRRIGLPGVLQLAAMGLLPLAVICIGYPLQVEALLIETAAGTFILSGAFYVRELLISERPSKRLVDLAVVAALIRYGVQRIPSILGLALMLSSPVIIAKHFALPTDHIIIIGGAAAMLRMLGLSNQLMTYILLPRVSWVKKHSPEMLPYAMRRIIAFALCAGFAASIGFLAAGDAVLRLWLHRPVLRIESLTVLFWFSAVPFVIVFFLRPTVDALHVRGYNALNVVLAVMVMCVSNLLGHFVFSASNPTGVGLLSSGLVLCVLSIVTVQRLVHAMDPSTILQGLVRAWTALLYGALLVAAAYAIRLGLNTGSLGPVLGIGLAGLAACALLAPAAWSAYTSLAGMARTNALPSRQ